eukprot:3819199-Rhodomonas_salina.1
MAVAAQQVLLYSLSSYAPPTLPPLLPYALLLPIELCPNTPYHPMPYPPMMAVAAQQYSRYCYQYCSTPYFPTLSLLLPPLLSGTDLRLAYAQSGTDLRGSFVPGGPGAAGVRTKRAKKTGSTAGGCEISTAR